MRFQNVSLESICYHLPETILTSEDIEHQLRDCREALGLTAGRLEAITGIRERRVWPVGTRPSSVAAIAGRKALDAAGVDPKNIGLLIHAGVCRDATEPSTANVAHHLLGLEPGCIVFDVSNACLGFLNSMMIAADLIQLGRITHAMVVSGENAGPIYQDTIASIKLDPSPTHLFKSIASLTLGSAALACVLCSADQAKFGHTLLGGLSQADSEAHDVCQGYGDINHQSMVTDTARMMERGLALSQVTWEFFKKDLAWENDTADHIFHHQVSRSHSQRAYEILQLDGAKKQSDLEWLGNTGSVAVPLSMALRADDGHFRPHDKIALLAIGSGLNCLMMGLEW